MMHKYLLTLFLLIILSATIIQAADKTNFTSSNLPIVVINTNGQNIPNEPRIVANMGIIYNSEGQRNYLTDPFNNYDGRIEIEKRGSSSQWLFPKKQYSLETQTSDGENLNVSLMDLPPENDWILHAPYSDKTMMRNVLVYKLATDMGWYASRTKFCELLLNDEYMGIYILMEKIKRDRNRLDISTLNPDEISGDDLTGGYIVKIDKTAGSENEGWDSTFPPFPGAAQRVYYQYHYPDEEKIVEQQRTYIRSFIYNFETIMQSCSYDDPENGYCSIIDMNSFIDYFLINEISKNVDGYRLSAYLYKDKDSVYDKLYIGPVWDFNLAFGNADYYEGWSTNGWQLDYFANSQEFQSGDGFQPPFWWQKIFNDPYFQDQVYYRWNELKEGLFGIPSFYADIDSITNLLNEAVERNYERWPEVLGNYIWPNPEGCYNRTTYESEIVWMKQWIADRIQWINSNIFENSINSVQKYPKNFYLNQNFPNPFNHSTNITYTINQDSNVHLNIFNLKGIRIYTLIKAFQTANTYSLFWNGRSMRGKILESGIYIMQLSVDGNSQSRKIVYLK